MPRRSLKVVGNLKSRCNSSDSRYMRENRYTDLALLTISYVLKLQDKHNASLFQFLRKTYPFPNAKLAKIIKEQLIIVLISRLGISRLSPPIGSVHVTLKFMVNDSTKSLG